MAGVGVKGQQMPEDMGSPSHSKEVKFILITLGGGIGRGFDCGRDVTRGALLEDASSCCVGNRGQGAKAEAGRQLRDVRQSL